MDSIVAMLSRIYPEPTSDAGRAEVRKHIKGFINNHRDLAGIFGTRTDQQIVFDGRPANLVEIGGLDQLHKAMNGFAARLGLALFYHTTGRIVPKETPIIARWYSNYELAAGLAPEDVVTAMGAPRTLQMGRQHVFPQFRYWAAQASDNPDYFGAFAVFRESFATFAGIRPDDDGISPFPDALRPGFLRDFTI